MLSLYRLMITRKKSRLIELDGLIDVLRFSACDRLFCCFPLMIFSDRSRFPMLILF